MISDSGLCGKLGEQEITQIEKTIESLGSKINIAIDYDGDIVLTNDNVPAITKMFSGWKKEVFTIINNIKGDSFTNQQLHKFIPYLNKIFPNAKTPDRTMSRELQELRDMGLIKFTSRGHYKKLWK